MIVRKSHRLSVLAAAAALFAGMLVVPMAHAAPDAGGVLWAEEGSPLVVTSADAAICEGANPEVALDWGDGSYSFTPATDENSVNFDGDTGDWSIDVSGVLADPGNYALTVTCDEDTTAPDPQDIGSVDVAITSLTAPTSLTVGEAEDVAVAGFAGTETVELKIGSTVVGSAAVVDGAKTIAVTVPASVTATSGDLVATGVTSGRKATVTGVTIVQPEPEPETPPPAIDTDESDVVLDVVAPASMASGGTAYLAGGKDPAELIVTLADEIPDPITGQAAALSVTSVPTGVTMVGTATEDGTTGVYTIKVSAAAGGTYDVTVNYAAGTDSAATLGPITVSFIGVDDPPTTVAPGDEFQVTVSGFQPDEEIEGTLNSDPIDLGTVDADGNGQATFDVTIPEDMTGTHTMTFAGKGSGTVTSQFTVGSDDGGSAQTGGSVVSTTAGLVGMILLIATGVGLGAFQLRRRLA